MRKLSAIVTIAAALLAGTTATAVATVPAAQPAAAAQPRQCGEDVYGYDGYWGQKVCGTRTMEADWNGDGSRMEKFVIGTDNAVWHIWPGSGGWWSMGGSADDTSSWGWDSAGRWVQVMDFHQNHYCAYDRGSGWSGWYGC